MVNLDVRISKHAKDLIQKYASGLFRNTSLEFYGVKTAKIKEIISVELPAVAVAGSSADFVFLLEDNTYLHFEFQSTYNEKDLVRFAGYDIRLYERDGRRVITVIIYTADVKHTGDGINLGSLVYKPLHIMMKDFDGDVIYRELASKIDTGQEIIDADMLILHTYAKAPGVHASRLRNCFKLVSVYGEKRYNLIFLPLMRNTIDKGDLVVTSVQLAQTIPDVTKRNACIASTFAFAVNYLNEIDMEKLKGVFKMFDKAAAVFGEVIDELLDEKIDEKINEKITNDRIDIAKRLFKNGLSAKVISQATGLEETTVQKLQSELNEAV